MKIHESHNAPNPRRVRVFLAEKGLEVTYEEVDIVKAVNREADFRKKNPLSTVPVLELDDGTCISESVAICRYFEELHPKPPLFGTDAKQRASSCGIAAWNSTFCSRSPTPFASATISLKAAFANCPNTPNCSALTLRMVSRGSIRNS